MVFSAENGPVSRGFKTVGVIDPWRRIGGTDCAMSGPSVAAAVLAGGNVRVGLEDNLWLEKGVLAENYQLVERAKTIIENMGARVMGPAALREKLGLIKRAPRG